jgi:glucosamine--fructose-6-phosphate aminotransferase (isomerizing)
MCGIVGYVGRRPAVDVLLRGLSRLEYRGYDSSGVAFFPAEGSRPPGGDGFSETLAPISIVKSEGRLDNVRKLLEAEVGGAVDSRCGIGHTRWATHGKPTTQNAHPHRTGHVVLVHNGIIENYQELKAELIARGHRPRSETDSELFGFLVLEEMERGLGLADAVRASFGRLVGACGVVVVSEREPGTVVGVRNGSPLAVALDPEGGVLLASDAQPLLEYTKDVVFLENGDLVEARHGELRLLSVATGLAVERPFTRLDWSPDLLDRQGFPHYMLKEIHEQPVALVDTLNGVLDRGEGLPFSLAAGPGAKLLSEAKSLTLVACGTSWHAALLGKYWLEKVARLSVQVELASEFRYRDPVLAEGTLVVGISQSGETADTLAVLRELRSRGVRTLAVTNVRGSSITREADATFTTLAGPEIGVAATKTFLSQLLVLLLWAGAIARLRTEKGAPTGSASRERLGKLFDDVLRLPHFLAEQLRQDSPLLSAVRLAAPKLSELQGFFFIGRGTAYPIALEGALKLKEIAYVHAEGYAAGELKHGPIAMIDEGMAVVVLAPKDAWREKTVSNLEEVKARGARIVGVGEADDEALRSVSDHWIPIPGGLDETLSPFLLSAVVQLLSYELALLKGTDVDKPRNLAKSVTVE